MYDHAIDIMINSIPYRFKSCFVVK